MSKEFEKITRTVNSKDLLHVYNNYSTMFILCMNAKKRAVADKNGQYLIDLKLDIVGKKKSKRNDTIKEYFDKIQKDLEDNTVLNLVATFEKLIFQKIPTTIDNSKKILRSYYNAQEPFASSIKSFVKSPQDINNISAILNILSGSITTTLENKLKEIIRQRNRIAHGRRFGEESNLTVLETLEGLDEALGSITQTAQQIT